MTTKTPPGRPPGRPTSEACAQLRGLLRLDSAALIGLMLGVGRETVMEYSRGRRRPDPRVRDRLLYLGIAGDAWKREPAEWRQEPQQVPDYLRPIRPVEAP
jgi:hypothetical protein